MRENGYNKFMEYLESLATLHNEIRHSETEKHFCRLDSDETGTAINSSLYFPCVMVDSYIANMKGVPERFFKERTVSLMIMDNVAEKMDFEAANNAIDRCESIADDFIAKIYSDFRLSELRFIISFAPTSAHYEVITNSQLNLYGIMVSFSIGYLFCTNNLSNFL